MGFKSVPMSLLFPKGSPDCGDVYLEKGFAHRQESFAEKGPKVAKVTSAFSKVVMTHLSPLHPPQSVLFVFFVPSCLTARGLKTKK